MTMIEMPQLNRRSFLKWTGVVAGTSALAGATACMSSAEPAGSGSDSDGKIVWSACTVNCGTRCPLRLVVKDGVITRVLPDNTGSNDLGDLQIRACVRGRSIRQRIYSPHRLKKPMKRVEGTKRGEGHWEEISWDQALDEIAEKMKGIKEEYGNEAFYIQYGTGVIGSFMACSWPPNNTPFARLMNTWGGYLDHYSDYSTMQITQVYPYFYGSWVDSNTFDDAKNAQLQVMFGNNPSETRMGGGSEVINTQQTKKQSGVKTIVIDPRYTETAVTTADEWIPIRPGTDAALVAGLIHVMLNENLHDQAFLDRYCVGFDEHTLPEGAPANSSYRAYIEGKGVDGTEKRPEWAARITGIPAETIIRLAREIGRAKPCAITQGWGPQRHANGENNARSIFLLACVTGNVGIPGGGTGAREGDNRFPVKDLFNTELVNPSEKIISCFGWMDAIEHGSNLNTFNAGVLKKPEDGSRAGVVPVDDDGNPTNISLDVPIKMIWQYGGNSNVGQTGDNNRTVELFQDETKCELLVVMDIQMTTSARYADYILPGTSTSEEFDYHPGMRGSAMSWGIVSQQAIEPMYECRSVFDVCGDLAKRFGTEEAYYGGKDREQWLRESVNTGHEADPDLPTYDEWKEIGLFRKYMGSKVALQDFRDDPDANPLKTPSGKIEIYSSRLAAMSEKWEFGDLRPAEPGDELTALPEYTAVWEGAEQAKEDTDYPLQIFGHHYKARTHSSYGDVEWLKNAHRQQVWINPLDAEERGIENGDQVFVYNERGTVKIEAKVTERIIPGVAALPQGAWFDPVTDITPPAGANPDRPVDIAGSMNTLSSHHPSPLAKGNAVHTSLVQIEKA